MSCLELSHKFQYSLIALLEIAKSYESGEARQIREIAAIHNIPVRYLDQLLGTLRCGGLIQSIRGSKGGYILAREPKKITVLDVYRCIENVVTVNPTLDSNVESLNNNVVKDIWQEVTGASLLVLQQYTLCDLCEKITNRRLTEIMYYI
ncbi:Rrf2 family transcriptional regulator [Nostoc sp. FACHB-110]|uniref:RrF2 family transcriptional regulator n=1 Tax=Nostoc sp. FACHB-110 TaxID=2692834 RepID=UPI00168524D8|nr:Rrf2 family transcriptional regulator [Nostoc sp. FACHB-110]MBD2441265.1 Rrf2 family transcriptional regulator [Nostoc sp. FACHB-110]